MPKLLPVLSSKKVCLNKKDWLLKMKKHFYVEKSQRKCGTFLNKVV